MLLILLVIYILILTASIAKNNIRDGATLLHLAESSVQRRFKLSECWTELHPQRGVAQLQTSKKVIGGELTPFGKITE